MTGPSIAWLAWMRGKGLDPERASSPTYPQKAAIRQQRIEALSYRIDRAERALANAEDRISEGRIERRLQGLEAQRDALEAEEAELAELAHGWQFTCSTCDRPIDRSQSNYGRGQCGACSPEPRRF